MTFEEALIEHCSPTLAGVKPASLFRFCPRDSALFVRRFLALRQQFAARGLRLVILKGCRRTGSYLLYLYRERDLAEVLGRREHRDFLRAMGYTPWEAPGDCLRQLAARLCLEEEFPHEIGVFLGYPLDDVKGFIRHKGRDYTFWGKGVSQGHSDAIRRIPGVKDARQYTVPVDSALASVRAGENPELTTRQKHTRDCYVVAEEGADLKRIEEEIVNMPNYFADYDTTVHFISEEELQRDHSGIPHGGFVIRSGHTGWDSEHSHVIEYSLKLDSNPEFTASVIVAYARAAYRMAAEGQKGCKTVFDVAPAYLSPMDGAELRKHLL